MSTPISYDATLPSTYGTATTNAGSSLAGYAKNTTARTPKQQLGQEDFLKLLATQFQQQDPMKPMEDTAFIAQMAQFSSLEQMSSLTSEMARVRADGQIQAANSMLGQRVEIDLGEEATLIGRVDAIDTTKTPPHVVIGETSYSFDSVRQVYAEELTPASA